MKALVIKQPWIDLILDGKKTWEMRARKTKIRGRIGLIEQGTGLIVGHAEIVCCLKVNPNAQYSDYLRNHCIRDMNLIAKYPFAWVLQGATRYEEPIPYIHPRGAVVWVNIQIGDAHG